MKKDQVRIGGTYSAKVSGGVVPVRITQETWLGDQHVGWVGTNTATGRSVRIKSAQRLRAPVGGTSPTSAPPVPVVAPHVGGGGVPPANGKVTAKAASPVPPKPTSGGKGNKATGGQKAAKTPKAKTAKPAKPPRKDRPMSGLDAAAKVLADARKPMHVGEIMGVIVKKGLWKSNGRTPEATLYAAIIREIAAKGAESRFTKVERGVFAANA